MSPDGESWDLRGAAWLAHLLRNANPRDEARCDVGRIYNWATSSDNTDLIEAKALLEQLNLFATSH